MVTLPAPWDRAIYGSSRPLPGRALLYAVDKILLFLRGVVLARRFRPSVVFCETVHHAVPGLAIARLRGIRCVWDSHGNGRLLYESLGKGQRATLLVEWLERFMGRRVDVLVTVSELDAAAYRRMGIPAEKIRIVPVCVQVPPEPPASRSPEDSKPANSHPVLLFFGSFRYFPNREALEFLNDRIAPFLERQGFHGEIRVAGRDLPALAYHPLVRPIGFVPDVHSEIQAATLCVFPVRRGVGTLTKVIDAMAAGTPVVLSAFAMQGIPEIRPGVHAYVAATDEEFLDCVVDALRRPEAARTMARRARQLVERQYNWQSGSERLVAALANRARTPGRDGS